MVSTNPFDGLKVSTTEYEGLAERTTFRVGGRARFFSRPRTVEEVAALFAAARRASIRTLILGGGSNLLIDDTTIGAFVIDIGRLSELKLSGNLAHAGAGARLSRLVREAAARGLAGAEALVGIPGTVGGAVVMNSGGRYGSISQVLQGVKVLDDVGDIRTLSGPDLSFGYRQSNLRNRIVLESTFSLAPSDPAEVARRTRQILQEKRRTQPLKEKTAGCIFKNPPGRSTGALIDQSGLKATRIGGAYVSPVHANFIVNDGTATFSDVMQLIELVRERVLKEHGVTLELEIEIWKQ